MRCVCIELTVFRIIKDLKPNAGPGEPYNNKLHTPGQPDQTSQSFNAVDYIRGQLCSGMNVLCDTSFLMVLVSTPVKRMEKIESEVGRLSFLIPDMVIEELKKLVMRTGPKRSQIARTAIEISYSKFRIVELPKYRQVDDSILEFAKASKCAVATLDKNLKHKLRKYNILVISLSNNRLMIDYPLKEQSFKYY